MKYDSVVVSLCVSQHIKGLMTGISSHLILPQGGSESLTSFCKLSADGHYAVLYEGDNCERKDLINKLTSRKQIQKFGGQIVICEVLILTSDNQTHIAIYSNSLAVCMEILYGDYKYSNSCKLNEDVNVRIYLLQNAPSSDNSPPEKQSPLPVSVIQVSPDILNESIMVLTGYVTDVTGYSHAHLVELKKDFIEVCKECTKFLPTICSILQPGDSRSYNYEAPHIRACVGFTHNDAAVDAMIHLDGATIGGAVITVFNAPILTGTNTISPVPSRPQSFAATSDRSNDESHP